MSAYPQYPRVLYASGGRITTVKNEAEQDALGPEWHLGPEGAWSGAHLIRRDVIDNTKFWAIRAPMICNYWSVRPDGACLVRSNVLNEDSEDTLAADSQELCIAPAPLVGPRYQIGSAVIYIKAVGNAPVVVHSRFML